MDGDNNKRKRMGGLHSTLRRPRKLESKKKKESTMSHQYRISKSAEFDGHGIDTTSKTTKKAPITTEHVGHDMGGAGDAVMLNTPVESKSRIVQSASRTVGFGWHASTTESNKVTANTARDTSVPTRETFDFRRERLIKTKGERVLARWPSNASVPRELAYNSLAYTFNEKVSTFTYQPPVTRGAARRDGAQQALPSVLEDGLDILDRTMAEHGVKEVTLERQLNTENKVENFIKNRKRKKSDHADGKKVEWKDCRLPSGNNEKGMTTVFDPETGITNHFIDMSLSDVRKPNDRKSWVTMKKVVEEPHEYAIYPLKVVEGCLEPASKIEPYAHLSANPNETKSDEMRVLCYLVKELEDKVSPQFPQGVNTYVVTLFARIVKTKTHPNGMSQMFLFRNIWKVESFRTIYGKFDRYISTEKDKLKPKNTLTWLSNLVEKTETGVVDVVKIVGRFKEQDRPTVSEQYRFWIDINHVEAIGIGEIMHEMKDCSGVGRYNECMEAGLYVEE